MSLRTPHLCGVFVCFSTWRYQPELRRCHFNVLLAIIHAKILHVNKLILFLLLLIESPFIFAAIENNRWHAGIGDASIFGWVTVAFYVLAAARCLVKAIASKKFGGYYQFWIYLAVFLLLLGHQQATGFTKLVD